MQELARGPGLGCGLGAAQGEVIGIRGKKDFGGDGAAIGFHERLLRAPQISSRMARAAWRTACSKGIRLFCQAVSKLREALTMAPLPSSSKQPAGIRGGAALGPIAWDEEEGMGKLGPEPPALLRQVAPTTAPTAL